MLDERILIPNSQRSEILLIVREHDQIVLPSCGSNRDILETGRDASAAGDCHELPGYRCRLEIKRQNAATVVVTNFSPPFSECCRFFDGTGSLGVRNTVLDLSRGDYGQPKVGRSLDYPGNWSFVGGCPAFRRGKQADDIRIQKVQRQNAGSRRARAGFRLRAGRSPSSNGEFVSNQPSDGTRERRS
jgi:hypothetical protein